VKKQLLVDSESKTVLDEAIAERIMTEMSEEVKRDLDFNRIDNTLLM